VYSSLLTPLSVDILNHMKSIKYLFVLSLLSISINSALALNVCPGDPAILTWSSAGATECHEDSANPQCQVTITDITGGSTTTNPTLSCTVTYTCTNSSGASASSSDTLHVRGSNNHPEELAPLFYGAGDAGCTTGTLSAAPQSCTITAGNSSCNTALTWSTANSGSNVSSITSETPAPNTTVHSGNTGTSVSTSVSYPSQTFYLYNNGAELDTVTVTASCSATTDWDATAGKCLPHVTASISASPTHISYNEQSTLTWASGGGATSCTAGGGRDLTGFPGSRMPRRFPAHR